MNVNAPSGPSNPVGSPATPSNALRFDAGARSLDVAAPFDPSPLLTYRGPSLAVPPVGIELPKTLRDRARDAIAALANNPEVAVLLAIMEYAQELREEGARMIEAGGGELLQEDMALLNETFDLAKQLTQMAQNALDARGEAIDIATR